MAVKILEDGDRNVVAHFNAAGTLNIATLAKRSSDGASPVTLDIIELWYDVGAVADASVTFDATTDDLAWLLTSNQHMCFEDFAGLKNPKSAGWNGSIIVTGTGAFTVVLKCRKSY